MALVEAFLGWPLVRQVTGRDRLGRGHAAQSKRSATLEPRTVQADKVVDSVCPFCAVGCAQKVFVKDGKVTQIEGNPASPISRGRLCPKGSASKQLVTSPTRVTKVRYRRPYASDEPRREDHRRRMPPTIDAEGARVTRRPGSVRRRPRRMPG